VAGAHVRGAAVGGAGAGRGPRDAALVPLPAGRQGVCRRRVAPAVEPGGAGLGRGVLCPRPRGLGAGPIDGLGQVVAVSHGRGPDRAAAALAGGARRGATLAGRGQRPLAGPRARRLGRSLPGRPAGRAGPRAHAAGLVRRGGPRADREGRGPRRAGARGAHRGAPGRVLCLDLRPQPRLGEAGQPGPEDPRVRRRRRDQRLHAHPRARRAGRQGPLPPRGRGRAFDSRRRQSGPGPGPSRRATTGRRGQAGAAFLGRARAHLPKGQGSPAGQRRAREAHGERGRLGVEAAGWGPARRGHARRGPQLAAGRVFPSRRAGRQAGQPPLGFSGVRAALRPGPGRDALPGRLPDRAPLRGHG